MPPKGAPAPTGTSVAKANQTAIAIQQTDFLYEQAQSGAPKIGMQDIIMPRLSILQDLSPAVNKRKPEYVDGAEAGMILNVATLELMTALRVIPCYYVRHHIEWKPNRGGFVADHGDDEAIMKNTRRDDKNFDILPNGNIIMPTPTWYCLHVGADGSLTQVVIPMPRTQSKTSRQWMSQATSEKLQHPTNGSFPAPLFYRAWDLGTFLKDDGDNQWFIWTAARGPSVLEADADGKLILPENSMQEAIRFRDMLVAGVIKADASHFEDGAEARGEQGQGGKSDTY